MSPVVIKKVALAGGTGTLGSLILDELVAAKYEVVLLTRSATSLPAGLLKGSITVEEVDYTSVESISKALSGVHALIDASSAPTPEPALNLIAAAAAASVYRVIPNYFGIDMSENTLSNVGIFAGKTLALQKVQELASVSPKFTWTAVSCGGFYDWALRCGFFDIDLAKREAKLWGDGETKSAVTNLSAVASATVAVLGHAEQTANRKVYIKSAISSQKHILDLAREALGGNWSVENLDIASIGKDAVDKITNGTAGMPEFYWCLKYGITLQKNTTAWEHSDNELLGVKDLSDEEQKQLIKSIAAEMK